jgi:prepilin-type processing-associated H-X9-DG protein
MEQDALGNPQLTTNFYYQGVWFCPSAKWSDDTLRSLPTADGWSYYGYNIVDIFDAKNRHVASTSQFGLQGRINPKTHTYQPVRESEVTVPSDMMAIGDGFEGNGILMRKPVSDFEQFGNVLARHQGKANVVFCDGHVESPTLQFLFADTSDAALARWNRDHLSHREKLAP